MAHGPSPFGVPRHAQGRRNETDPGFDWSEYDESEHTDARMNARTVRLGPDAMSSTSIAHTPEEDMEAQLEHLHASRPLRRAAQRARRRTKWWLVALAIVSALAVAAACAAGAFIVLQGDDPDQKPQHAATGGAQESSMEDASHAPEVVDPIASRETDAEPISVAELFGADAITPAGAAGPYEVLGTEELADCAEAGLDELAELLADSGCTQVVRATVVSPDGEFAATAGVLNLADADEAEAMRAAIDAGLEGGFAALRTEGEAAELGRAATMVGYNTYGHYLMYVVIGRTDGEAIEDAGDPVRTIVGDIVDVWFVDQLKPRRDVQ